MASIFVTRTLPSSIISRLEAVGTVEVFNGDGTISPEELRATIAGKDALVSMLTDRIDAGIIDAATHLKLISNVAVGYNNIDVAHARSRGIIVTNTPDVLTESVADFTWGLILAVTRRLSEGERLLRRGAWKGWAFDFMLGTELRGKQLGLVGFGRIAQAVARKAPAFGMRRGVRLEARCQCGWRHIPVDRSAPQHLGRRVPARSAHYGDTSPHRSARAGTHEAVGISHQHRARPCG